MERIFKNLTKTRPGPDFLKPEPEPDFSTQTGTKPEPQLVMHLLLKTRQKPEPEHIILNRVRTRLFETRSITRSDPI